MDEKAQILAKFAEMQSNIAQIEAKGYDVSRLQKLLENLKEKFEAGARLIELAPIMFEFLDEFHTCSKKAPEPQPKEESSAPSKAVIEVVIKGLAPLFTALGFASAMLFDGTPSRRRCRRHKYQPRRRRFRRTF